MSGEDLGKQARSLPIYDVEREILTALYDHKVIVVEGPTGCGKTTQLPRMLLHAGLVHNRIGITQPRRIAAVSVASRIAQEEARFDLNDVASGITEKLIRRHPHVFADTQAIDSEAVRDSWAAIKARERSEIEGTTTSVSPISDRLAAKVRGQPALQGAMTISKQAAKAGFEWDTVDDVWAKVQEELDELKEAVAADDPAHAQEELGDVLFTLVNVARWCGIRPEEGLAGTNHRFLDRFSRVEAALGGDLQGRSITELEGLWQQAKAAIRMEAESEGH